MEKVGFGLIGTGTWGNVHAETYTTYYRASLAPGFFRSGQTIWASEQNRELGEKLLAKVPMGRMGKLEELEGTIVYLASPASDYMTGQALILDGGFLSW
jgi:NAD(P)-dependent dehydrogenase (short-subunit alcohol dehydrogenase family)